MKSPTNGLQQLASPELDAVFWTPELLGTPSTWWSHVPFAGWIMAACAPNVFVELGTRGGVSYAAFCEAALKARAGTRCYAVGAATADSPAAANGGQPHDRLTDLHDTRYGAFSELLNSSSDDAVSHFDDGSIDLLHIDGVPAYEAVKQAFEAWLPKLSNRAVVLLHDSNVRTDDFGVHRLFRELAKRYPNFEFLHGRGLGLIAVGDDAPAPVKALCSIEAVGEISALRQRFSHIGSRWSMASNEQLAPAASEAGAVRPSPELKDRVYARAIRRLGELRAVVGRVAQENAVLQTELGERSHRVSTLEGRLMKAKGENNYLLKRYATAFNDPSTGIKARLKTRLLFLLRPFTKNRLHAKAQVDLIRRSPYFDRDWYLQTYSDARASGADPAVHYLVVGGFAGQDPGPLFSSRDYLELYPEVARAKLNPLLHYIEHGERAGRLLKKPSPAETDAPRPLLPRAEVGQSGRNGFSMLFISGEPDTPGNRYRVLRYVDAVKANGVHASWIRHGDLTGHLQEISKFDVVVIWRAPWDRDLSDAIDIARVSGAKVVFDVDDLMTEPDLVQVEIIDGIRSQQLPEEMVRDHFIKIRKTMLESDLCMTTTEELAYFIRWTGKATHVLPNGFDNSVHDCSRIAAQGWRAEKDQLIRIGYAGGSRTHQRDFGVAVEALARILRENPLCRLVLFSTPHEKKPLIDVHEYPSLAKLGGQIEWRELQQLEQLPLELARFDINLAPLEVSNPFCEAKSELKFFEAALVNVPTVASPTGPYRRAIEHGQTGFLAATADDWYVCLDRLVRSPELRERIALKAYHAALANYGPLQRNLKVGRFIDQLRGGVSAARGFALQSLLARQVWKAPKIYPSDVVFEQSKGGYAAVTVVIPLYNYEQYVREALDSVLNQTLEKLDLVVVDGCSTDDSLAVAVKWAKRHADRFNRIVVLKNQTNIGLGFCRNSGFSAAESRYVLPLDADNRLLPECCESLLAVAESSGAAYVYPTIQHFGASTKLISNLPYDAQRFVAGNFVDAMALVSKEAWALVGGYDHVRHGWEDYDFWCRLAEVGLAGEWCSPVLAEYRVHPQSMMTIQTLVPGNYSRLHSDFERRHPWVALQERHSARTVLQPSRNLSEPRKRTRLDDLLPILRCPITKQKLIANPAKDALVSVDGTQTWPIISGRPVLSRENASPSVLPVGHISNELPDEALGIIRSTKGWVLNLSAGGSREKFDHVVEVEYAIFRHTDLVADAHVLPFDDESFEAIVVMNAFEHYREPHVVAAELFRILKPGGTVMIRTAFLQPLHERPWHFFNCTKYGLEEWFKAFETDKLHVSENFTPNHSIAWLASECETALRQDVSARTADAFLNAKIGDMVDIWRNPVLRESALWTEFNKVSQTNQEVTAAGFEYFGRKPVDRPKLNG